MAKGEMSITSAAQLGGARRKALAEPGEYREMGKKGGTTTKLRHGFAHYSRIGKMGGATRQAQGVDYKALGATGGRAARRLLEAGKKLEAAALDASDR